MPTTIPQAISIDPETGLITIRTLSNVIIDAQNITLDIHGNMTIRGSLSVNSGDFVLGESVLDGPSQV